MKGLNWKKIAAMGMALALTCSSTAFAAEVIETGRETEQKAENETEHETEKPEKNGTEMLCYTLEAREGVETVFNEGEESEQTESEHTELLSARKITLEELENLSEFPDEKNLEESNLEESKLPHRVMLVFQPVNYWQQPETEITEAPSDEMVPLSLIHI